MAINIALFGGVGFCSGMTHASRDILVRAAAPEGATGKVFGFVYSGMDFGSASTPILFGWFVDTGIPRSAFLCVAILWVVSVVIVVLTNRATQQRRAVAAE